MRNDEQGERFSSVISTRRERDFLSLIILKPNFEEMGR